MNRMKNILAILSCLILLCLSLDFYNFTNTKTNLYNVSSVIDKDILLKHYLDYEFIDSYCASENIDFELLDLDNNELCTYRLKTTARGLIGFNDGRTIMIKKTIWIQHL